MCANFRQNLYFADSLDREKYSVLKQHYEQMMRETLQSNPRVCVLYVIYAYFHLFKCRKEEITGDHHIIFL